MSPVLVAILALSAPPSEGVKGAAAPPAAPSAEKADVAPRKGAELRKAVRTALPRWARPTDAEADSAAREFLTLYAELRADDQLAPSQREYLCRKVRFRLRQLSDQISKRIAREKTPAKTPQPKTVKTPQGKAETLAQQQRGGWGARGALPGLGGRGPGFGGGALRVPDNAQQLVELIQTVIRPETWDVNGGPGTIYYWYPGRALVIRQTGDVLDEIDDALDLLRRAGR